MFLNNIWKDSQRLQYYSNVTRFSNVRTFLALLRTCAVFVGLAIYLKNKYIFTCISSYVIWYGRICINK